MTFVDSAQYDGSLDNELFLRHVVAQVLASFRAQTSTIETRQEIVDILDCLHLQQYASLLLSTISLGRRDAVMR
jgi:hypothetical protein